MTPPTNPSSFPTGSTGLAVAGLLLNAFVWGVSWWPFRQLESQGLHPLWSTALIYAVAVVCVLCWRPRAWQGLWHFPALWLLMLASGLTNVGFNWAVTTGDVVCTDYASCLTVLADNRAIKYIGPAGRMAYDARVGVVTFRP
jgi:drug/metabolite transporter (DMT)-like permease